MPSAAYNAEVAEFGRRVQWLVELDLDRCSLTYTVGACAVSDLGDGSRCHYTWGTCQIQSAYTKTTRTWRFCLNNVPWPDTSTVAYPLLKRIVTIPQKIDADRLTVYPEKVTAEFEADYNPLPFDADKGAGFFNTGTAGEFWRCLIARNRNYSGRAMRVLRGFYADGFLVSDFEQIGPTYKIKEVQIGRDGVRITAESPLADLGKVNVPWTISDTNTVQADITDTGTTVTVNDGSEFPDPADFTRNTVYIQCETEAMEVSSISTDTLTVVRGALGTTAVAHAAGAKLSHVFSIGTPAQGRTPTDALQDILEFAKVQAASVNTTSFDTVKYGFWPGEDLQAIIRRPKRASEIIAKIREPRQLLLYLDADGKFACQVMGPVASTVSLDETQSATAGSTEVNEDQDARITRAYFWYDPDDEDGGGSSALADQYHRAVVSIDATLETANNYGDERSQVITDAYIRPTLPAARVANLGRRLVARKGNGLRYIAFELDLIDATSIAIGTVVELTTRQVLNVDGSNAVVTLLITQREETTGSRVLFTGVDITLGGRYARIMSNTATDDYDTASASEKLNGGYWGNATTNKVGTAAVDDGYVFW